MKHDAIGGYFSLELTNHGGFFHQDGLLLNSGRNALEFILRSLPNIQHLWLPYYTCEVVMEPIEKLSISYSRYHIDKQLQIAEDIPLGENDYLLYTNYFGLKDNYVRQLAERYGDHLIVDNAQAWYAEPIEGASTFYSPRKFFGLPDGGVAYCPCGIDPLQFEQDYSYNRCSHLLKRIDLGATEGYADFRENSHQLAGQPIRRMSTLTKSLMNGIDYKFARECRLANFRRLDAVLSKTNHLHIPLDEECVPMVYPYLTDNAFLKQQLIAKRIFVATYWPNVLDWCKEKDLEYSFSKGICFLPIDQRFNESDMKRIIESIYK